MPRNRVAGICVMVFRMNGNSLRRTTLIIAYSRPGGVLRLFESCVSAGIEKIYISLDGPRDLDSLKHQEEILKIVEKYSAIIEIEVNLLSENCGVAVGVLRAVDWYFSKEPIGIVLEDDLIVSPFFFEYVFNALHHTKDFKDILMVAGTQLYPGLSEYSLAISYPMIWGWGAWAEDWFVIRKCLLRKKTTSLSQLWDGRTTFWKVGANRALNGLVDTWDTPIAYEFYQNGFKCIIPPFNLVSNIGTDRFAAHTSIEKFPMHFPITENSDFGFQIAPPQESSDYEKILENSLFHISKRHYFLQIWAFLTDWFYFPPAKRRKNLKSRLKPH